MAVGWAERPSRRIGDEPNGRTPATLLGSLRGGFGRGGLKTISGCYAVPSLVLSDTGSVPIAAREEIEAAFDGAAERYRAQGLVAVRPTLVASEALSERLVSVDVHWDYLDEQGRSAQQNGYRYVLRLDKESSPRSKSS